MAAAPRQTASSSTEATAHSLAGRVRRLGIAVLCALGLMVHASYGGAAPAAAPARAPSAPSSAPYSAQGADTCLRCHDTAAVTVIFQTPHGVHADAHTPFGAGQLQCEACHGPGGAHTQHLHLGQKRPPMPFFAPGSTATIAQENTVCLSCHQSAHVGWMGSVHQRAGLACITCHRIHAARDPVTVMSRQPQVCYQCHQNVRADFAKFSAHPVQDGDMDCSACHAVHDSLYPALLIRPTVNQTCYGCHAQMRGPFLWEHPPVAENCSNCHVPHGSVNTALLITPPPLLCQQCHSPLGHPSIPFTGSNLPGGGAPSGFVLAGSCLNCHSQIHGSDSPSGQDLTR